MAVRIFVGGLPAGVTADELAQRFKSFGEVEACELVPDKLYATARPNFIPEKFSRNFGYVTLVPNGDKSVSKAMGVYNGAKWRGAVLRCQLAKPSGTEGILREIEDETVKKEEASHFCTVLAFEELLNRCSCKFNTALFVVAGSPSSSTSKQRASAHPQSIQKG